MKKFILAALAAMSLMLSAPAATAAPVSKEALKTQIKSGRYAGLLERYKAGESLTADEAATVYYGSALQPGFNPAVEYTAMLAAYNQGDMARAYRLCEEALAGDPTNLTLLFKAFSSASASVDPAIKAKAPVYQTRLLAICDAIFNSGTGVADNSPYMLIRPSDTDEFLVKYMQPAGILGRARIGQTEAIKVRLDGVADDVILYFSIFK